MRARMASVTDTAHRIVAITGSLVVLAGTAYGASAHESPSDEGDVTDLSIPTAIDSPPCMRAELPTAPLQFPPGDPNVPMCPDDDGYGRPCDPKEIFDICVQEAKDEYEVCAEDAGFWKRQGCRLKRAGQVAKCVTDQVVDQVLSF